MLKREKSCGALVFRKDQDSLQFLLLKSQFGGHWSFPKGHMESGESEVQTSPAGGSGGNRSLHPSHRRVSPVCRVLYQTQYQKADVYFLGSSIDPQMSPVPQEEEVSELQWMDSEKARQMVTFENDRRLIYKATQFLQHRK